MVDGCVVGRQPRALRLAALNTRFNPSIKALVMPRFQCATGPARCLSTILRQLHPRDGQAGPVKTRHAGAPAGTTL